MKASHPEEPLDPKLWESSLLPASNSNPALLPTSYIHERFWNLPVHAHPASPV